MILGQTEPYIRDRRVFTRADWFGSQVANHDLVDSVLAHSAAVEAVHIFSDDEQVPRPPGELGRLKTFPATAIAGEIDSRDYVFVTHGVDFYPLGQVRLATRSFPISAIVHTIQSPTMMLSYLAANIYAECFDSIVVTSEAGEHAVRALWDAASELLNGAFSQSLHRRPPLITRIPLGVDTDFLAPGDKVEARRVLGFDPDSLIVLYLGRLSEKDKADLSPLLRAFSKLAPTREDLRLVVAGQDTTGDYSERIRQICAELSIADKVSLLPNFVSTLKPYLYSAADIFVSPVDNVQETFGISVVEAMSCGLPVIASDWSGYRDLVVDGATGFLIPTEWKETYVRSLSPIASVLPHHTARHCLAANTVVDPQCLTDRLADLIQHPEVRRAFGSNGRQRVLSRYSWQEIIKSLDNLWQQQSSICCKTPRRTFALDYAEVFRQFPSPRGSGVPATSTEPVAIRCNVAGVPK